MPRQFQEPVAFGSEVFSYRLLPFRFLALDSEREILVNEAENTLTVPAGTARKIVKRDLEPRSDLYLRLRAGQFLFDDQSSPLLDILATKYRTKKSFLGRLHKTSHFCRHPPLRTLVPLLSGVAPERRPAKIRHDGGDGRKGPGSDVQQPGASHDIGISGGRAASKFRVDPIHSSSCEGTRRQKRKRPGHCCRDEPGRRHGRDASSIFATKRFIFRLPLTAPLHP